MFAWLATQGRFKLVRFDRGGPTEYPWIDIHTQPVAFIQCILLLAGQDLQKLGFDPTIYYNESGVRCIDVIERRPQIFGPQQQVEMTTYEDVTPFSHSRSIRGSGEVGWSGKRKGSPENEPKKVIFDRWVHVDRLPEKEFYRRIKAAGVEGVVHVEIWQPRDTELTTRHIRFGYGNPVALDNGNEFPDLILTRSVTKLYATITAFGSQAELLEVLRDAVLGMCRTFMVFVGTNIFFPVHQDLLKKAEVLHREFDLNTILINDSNDGGRKALLSGFAMAKTVFSETVLPARGLGNDSLVDTDLHVVCFLHLQLKLAL